MGGNVALNFGLAYPRKARALIVAGAGTGSTDPDPFRKRAIEFAQAMETGGMAAMEGYAKGPTRVQLLRKDPRGWEEFHRLLTGHSPVGSALTYRGFLMKRPTIFALEEKLRALQVPTLIMIGDEDEPCIEPAIFMKRYIPRSGLAVFPQSGHAINLEEPDLFNRTVWDFLTSVEAGRWAGRG